MAESKASIKAGCKKVCQELAEREKAWLDKFYGQTLREIKEKETVELVQHAIGLPLQAQERVQKFFTEQGVAYVNTAWRELSAQLPQLDYEYIDWSLPSENLTGSGVRRGCGKEAKRKRFDITVRTRNTKLIDTQERRMKANEKLRDEELRRRAEEMRGRNKNRVDRWCEELENRMVSVLEKASAPQ